jgi:hypothetical protein
VIFAVTFFAPVRKKRSPERDPQKEIPEEIPRKTFSGEGRKRVWFGGTIERVYRRA